MRLIGLAVVLVVGLVLAPTAAEAQQAAKTPRIAFISTTSPGTSPSTDAFRQGLRDLGYVEGQNIAVEWRWGYGSTKRFPEFAAEAVRLKVDLIVIPNMGDPVGSGFVTSLASPGGNITGLTVQNLDLVAKRLQLLKEATPNVSQVGLILDTNAGDYRQTAAEAETAARVLGIQLRRMEVSNPSELDGAFATIAGRRPSAVFVPGGTMVYANRTRLAEYALKRHLPMMCGSREVVEAGCLMGYAASLVDLFRRAATYVDRILKGAKPADLPVEQPTKFELVINLKTAKALGLTIPQSVLGRADQVIE